MTSSIGSTSSLSSSPPNVTMSTAELIADEKEDMRRWLRAEMDSLVDPLIDKLFHKFNNKFINVCSKNQSGNDDGHDRGQFNHILELSYNRMHQPEMNHFITPLNEQHGNVNYSQQTHFKSNSNQLPATHCTVSTNTQIAHNQSQRIIIKEEVEEGEKANKPITTTIIQCTTQSSSNSSISNEQSNQNQNITNWKADEEEEEEEADCECEDCLNDEIHQIKKEVDDVDDVDDDRIEWIDNGDNNDNNEDTSRAPKRQRIEDQQEQQVQQPANDSNENQYNNKQTVIIILSVECLQPNCGRQFVDRDHLDEHLKLAHSVEKYRCFGKDCNQSFDNRTSLTTHLRTDHSNVTKWQCSQCSKQCSSYNQLCSHSNTLHHPGRFQCAFPECTFIGEVKGKVYSHYNQQHKLLLCQYPNCQYRSKQMTKLKEHQMAAHLNIKPYRCKWFGCDYAGTCQSNALRHIRGVHLSGNSNVNSQEIDPKQYIEVMLM